MDWTTYSQFHSRGIEPNPYVQNGGAGYTAPPYSSYGGDYGMDPNTLRDIHMANEYYKSTSQYYSPGYSDGYNYYGGNGQYQYYQQQQQQPNTIGDICSRRMNGMPQGGGYVGNRHSWFYEAQAQQQRYQQQQQQWQQYYDNQRDTFRRLMNINNSYYGIPTATKEEDDQRIIEMQRQQQQWQQRMQEDYEIWAFTVRMSHAKSSKDKDYVTPQIQQWRNHVMSVSILQRHRDENYDLDAFLNGGLARDMMYDQLREEEVNRQRNLDNIYDPMKTRQGIAAMHPDYDPIEGVSIRAGMKLFGDELEVTVPPEIAKQRYLEKKDKFFKSIFSGSRFNFQPPSPAGQT